MTPSDATLLALHRDGLSVSAIADLTGADACHLAVRLAALLRAQRQADTAREAAR